MQCIRIPLGQVKAMYLYLILGVTALTITAQDIFKKKFNQKTDKGAILFGGMIALFAMLFFTAVNDDWSYQPRQLGYSFLFAVCYATTTLCAILAIKHGSLAKTSLVISCSLLVPSLYGMLFLGESVGWMLILGTVALIVSLILINYEKVPAPATVRWYLLVALAFIGNGMCSTVQKLQQIRFGETGKNTFMIVALAMVTVILVVASIFSREERESGRETLKKGWLFAALCGVLNGLCNYLVLYLNPLLPASVMFPVISAGSVVMVFIYATVFQHERFNTRQLIGYGLGVLSIILLNL